MTVDEKIEAQRAKKRISVENSTGIQKDGNYQKKDLCSDCPILKAGPCIIQARAYDIGLSGMEVCEVREAVEKILYKIANDGDFHRILRYYKYNGDDNGS